MLISAYRPVDSAYKVQLHVIRAVILRDIRTRFFGHGLGYLLAIAWPLAHIVILLGIYSGMGRTVPYGTSALLYFSTGLVPVMSFIYSARCIMLSVVINQPLLNLPIVKVTDLVIARGILEVLSACCMTLIMITMLTLVDVDVRPMDVIQAAEALAASILLGLGFGVLNAVLARAFPFWVTGFALICIVIYITSGVLFTPDSLPELGREIVSWNPILHGVEWMRAAFYEGYGTRTLDKGYLLGFGFGALFLGLLLERTMRVRLLEG